MRVVPHAPAVALAAVATFIAVDVGHRAFAQTARNEPQVVASHRASGFGDLVERLGPAVVNISVAEKVADGQVDRSEDPLSEEPSVGHGSPKTHEALSLGSGFIISSNGFIVTNNHVLTGGDGPESRKATLKSITVTLADRTEIAARIVGRDALADIAVLKVDDPRPLPFVTFGDSTKTRVGDWVIAVGNPFALGGTVTAGIVSAIHRSIGDIGPYHRFIQTDAAINSGNSGGPLFDASGQVVGINNIIQASGGGGSLGIGFAIPAEEAKPVVDVLMRGESVKRGYLGVAIQPVDDSMAAALGMPKDHGEIVARIEPGQPAARAGIEPGDVIMSVNGEQMGPDVTLTYAVSGLRIGTRVPIELLRRGARLTVTAVVGERPRDAQLGTARVHPDQDVAPSGGAKTEGLGAVLLPLTTEAARRLGVPTDVKGVVIVEVEQDSDLAQKGLERGDVIVSIDQQPTSSVAAAAAAVAAVRRAGRDTALLLVQRGGQPPAFVGVTVLPSRVAAR